MEVTCSYGWVEVVDQWKVKCLLFKPRLLINGSYVVLAARQIGWALEVMLSYL